MPKFLWLEIPLCILAVIGTLLVVISRLFIKISTTKDGIHKEAPRGIGSRMIQLIALLLLIPLIVILAVEGTLSKEVTGTLLGSIVGYALSGIGSED
jgi:hypothetical protein